MGVGSTPPWCIQEGLSLIFSIWASELPPRAWRTTEKAGPDRVKAIKIIMAEIPKEVPTKFKIYRTFYTLVQLILRASIFCLVKTFLRHDERIIKHIDHDLMKSGHVTGRAH